MDLLSSLKISASGLAANKKRIAAINSNIANAQVTRTTEGGPYRRKEVVFGSEPVRESFSDVMDDEMDNIAQTVHATEVISTDDSPIMKYDPNHPDANEQGMVAYPNVNTMIEMANLISAQRSYEANLNAISVTKSMASKALEIGR